MLTLHDATEHAKSLVKWGIISIVAIVLLIFIYNIGTGIKEYFYPTPPPPPTVSFGKLPEISLPELPIAKSFTYLINTVTGALPSFPDRIDVYKIRASEPSLLNLKRARDRISSTGFTSSGTALTNTLYQWKDSGRNSLSRNLLLDIQSFDFTLNSDFLTNSDVKTGKNIPDESGAKDLAQTFLSNLSSFPDDIDVEKTTTKLLSIKNFSVIPATSLSNAQLIRVDFFQKNINKLPIYYPNPPYSTMNVFVAGGNSQGQVAEAHFSHRLIDTSSSATYPIKTAKEAFDELSKGNAYITSSFDAGSKISIKNVSLGYYLGQKDQAYLMPIIVFQGSNEFYAYVLAIKDQWIQKESK